MLYPTIQFFDLEDHFGLILEKNRYIYPIEFQRRT